MVMRRCGIGTNSQEMLRYRMGQERAGIGRACGGKEMARHGVNGKGRAVGRKVAVECGSDKQSNGIV